MPEKRTRSYKMGHRNNPEVAKKQGLLSKNRWAWVRVYFGQFVIWADYVEDNEGNQTDQVRDIKLMHPIPNRPPVTWNLTACTEEELVALKHLFDTAFQWALPFCRQRDQEAQDALNAGDDSHSRIYRQVPQLVYRSGPEQEHREGLQHRSENAADLPPGHGNEDGGLRTPQPDVAERDEGERSTQDDGPQINLPPGVRQVGEVGD